MSQQNRQTAIQRGQQAAQELPLYKEFMARLREISVSQLLATEAHELERRERLIVTVQVIDTITRSYEKAIRDGSFEEKQAEFLDQMGVAQ